MGLDIDPVSLSEAYQLTSWAFMFSARETEGMLKGHPVKENMHNDWKEAKLGTQIAHMFVVVSPIPCF